MRFFSKRMSKRLRTLMLNSPVFKGYKEEKERVLRSLKVETDITPFPVKSLMNKTGRWPSRRM